MASDSGVVGLGVDLVLIETVQLALKRDPEAALAWLSEGEHDVWRAGGGALRTLAGRVAAKEAVAKALGTGFNDAVAWQDIEIQIAPSGAPGVKLTGGALAAAEETGIRGVLVSISHVDTVAAAMAIGIR